MSSRQIRWAAIRLPSCMLPRVERSADGGARALDQSLGDDVPAAADGSGADYYVRIFTPSGELPFAGHPTLGSCHAWLAAGGKPRKPGLVMQQCGVGLVRVRCDGPRLEFAAPPLRRTGPLEPDVLAKIATALALSPSDIVHHQWVDNGPGWCAVMLRSARQVLSLKPDWASLDPLKLGVVGPHEPATMLRSKCARSLVMVDTKILSPAA